MKDERWKMKEEWRMKDEGRIKEEKEFCKADRWTDEQTLVNVESLLQLKKLTKGDGNYDDGKGQKLVGIKQAIMA